MNTGAKSKPLLFVRSSRKDLSGCPPNVRRTVGFALYQAQNRRKHVYAKPLKGFGGAGVLEVVVDQRGSTFRAVYTVKFARAVCLLHVFQKKSKAGNKTPKPEMNLIIARLRDAQEL